ncbi:hypothetical protein JOC25_001272 [Solibacillus kalamii]|uniref:SLH domain-containing protein n=1 Tax=Solibacillus kalamii TaxID=1748298 RepID=A0ABX3ZM53_9BACL|nr:S-layer homology domain-containing protein [Solibacillus kalamii]MBM7664813.1 hypothetical protein [Solibacillus kalamii]OUZ40812.1 hypothetical protein CBM15_02760 [Solibacillus kalamii]
MANQPKKYKKFVATAATATLVASAIVPVASAASLSDIKGNTHEEAITSLVDAGVINGYPDGTFQPNKTLTRSDVVKLLGKYLVSKGLEVPADYKTNVRFNDLTSASNDELLKYAAVVYDAGVFSGSNGNLLAGDNITRENMAVVLVRAFDTLNNIDLVSYVQGQEYKKDVKDLFTAKAEARAAIEVLDFFDITNPSVANFNPKGSTTRGQFATFLYKTINTDFSAVTGVANSAVSEIKAINNTTVEVTFKDAIDNKEALDFTIDGLEVKNAVVKQTDAKTFVLTTAAQTGDKVYTLNVNAAKAGTFKGISAVVPTAIKLTTPSVQGTIGKEVTVKAEVTVPTGQSKAGIPVTFNIVNDNANLNEKKEVVAYTNEEGVATYTYTRYYKNNDSVTAYATDKSSVFASGKVYWAQGLTVTEVTSGNVLANGSKKVYKIKTDTSVTETFGTTSTSDDYNYVNVAFLENVDVAPDKLVRGVSVIDTGLTTNASYPSQVTTGGVQVVRVKVNANGEGTFTLTGSNGSVTPVVFVDDSTNKVGKYTATALQAAAPAVKFELNHTLGLSVKAEGVQNAAAINTGNANNKGTGEGGREYTVTVTDKDGKVAPAGTKAYVTFADGSYSTDKAVYIKSGTTRVVANKSTRHEITVTGSKGEAKFTLVGNHDAYATPTVYLENGSEAGLDKNDLQTVGEGTYFVDAVIANAALTVLNADGKEVTTLPSTQTAYFEYQSVDQNGFDYFAGTGSYEVSYQVTAQFADIVANGKTVKAGTTETIKVNAVNGKAVLPVTSTNVASNVSVQASASLVSLPNQTATLAFTKGTQVPDVYTGNVSLIDTVNNKLTFAGFDAITYSTSSFKNEAGVVISESRFETLVSEALATNSVVKVTSVKNSDGTYTLEIESITGSANVPVTVTSTKVLDVNGDGNADTIDLVFSKNVDATKLNATDFAVTNGTVASITDGTADDNKISLAITGATGLNLGTLTVSPKAAVAVDGAALASSTFTLASAIAGTGVAGTVAVGTAGTAGTAQVETLTATAATGTGDAIVTIVAKGFNGNTPLNITVPVIGSDTDTTVGTKVYNALKANTAVTGFFDVTQGSTTEEVVLTAKTAAADDSTMVVTLANNVTTATSVDTTAGVAPGKEVATLTITSGATNAGTVAVSLVDGTFTKTLNVSVAAGDSTSTVASKVFAALIADNTVTGHYDITISGAVVTLTEKVGGVGTASSGTIK